MNVYSTDEVYDFEVECPEQVAANYFSYEGSIQGDIIQVYVGESYQPTNQEEIDGMTGEGWTYLVKNIKPYKIFGYDESSDSVYEIDISQINKTGV